MFLREGTSKRKTGPDAVYVQLVHSDWDPEREQSRTRILHSFGRKEELDTDQLRRLSEQCRAYLPPDERADGEFEVTDSWQLGGPHLLDGLWRGARGPSFLPGHGFPGPGDGRSAGPRRGMAATPG